jgi:hypothetical protein
MATRHPLITSAKAGVRESLVLFGSTLIQFTCQCSVLVRCISNGAFGILVVAPNRENSVFLQPENFSKLAGVIVEVQIDFFRYGF